MPKLLGYAIGLMALIVLARGVLGQDDERGREGGATNRIVARSITIVDEKKQVRAFLGLEDEDDPNRGVRLQLFDGNGREVFTVVEVEAEGGRLYMNDGKGRPYLQILSVDAGRDHGGLVRLGGMRNDSLVTSVMWPDMLTFETDGKETYRLRPSENGK